jgi:hypothetical protein
MIKKYKHKPTGLVLNLREKKNTGMPVMLEEVDEEGKPTGVVIFSGFVRGSIMKQVKDWEEVKEPEWEILSFEKCGEIYPNKESEHYLLRGDYSIYAVKRL